MKLLISALCAYLLGSFCSSIPMSRCFYKSDVRDFGSSNAGATNASRVYGLRLGIFTLLLDVLKTIAAMKIGSLLCGTEGMALSAAVCLVGHCFPLYFGFRGGKGVSVGAGIGIMCGAFVFTAILTVFLAAAVSSKKVSLGSVCAALTLPMASALFGCEYPLLLMNVFACILIVYMHRKNIRRLIDGTEADFKLKKTA